MPKSLVGTVKNERFAFFWLLVGASIGNILVALSFPNIWPIFLPSAILSVLIAVAMVGKTRRPKIWLGIDLLLSIILSIFFVVIYDAAPVVFAILLPNILIILGCILGIMNW